MSQPVTFPLPLRRTGTVLAAFLAALPATFALAHHSVTANFDRDRQIEIHGTVVDWKLRSPHSSLVVDGIGYIDGEAQSDTPERWEIESSAAPSMRARGYTEHSIKYGDEIVVIGSPSRRGLKRANSSTFEREDGTSYASTEAATPPAPDFIPVDAEGIYRLAGRWRPPFQQEGTESALPLNEKGLAAWRAYDQTQSPANTCEPMSFPVVFNAPNYFLDLRLSDGEAVLRNQAYDIVRTIPLDGSSAPADPEGQFGIVSGRIEGDTLVIDSHDYPVSKWGLGAATQINGGGADVPSSPQKTLTESFSVSDDAQTLTYRYTLYDPVYMARPHTASIELARVPDDTPWYAYNCEKDAASMFSRAAGESLLEGDE